MEFMVVTALSIFIKMYKLGKLSKLKTGKIWETIPSGVGGVSDFTLFFPIYRLGNGFCEGGSKSSR